MDRQHSRSRLGCIQAHSVLYASRPSCRSDHDELGFAGLRRLPIPEHGLLRHLRQKEYDILRRIRNSLADVLQTTRDHPSQTVYKAWLPMYWATLVSVRTILCSSLQYSTLYTFNAIFIRPYSRMSSLPTYIPNKKLESGHLRLRL